MAKKGQPGYWKGRKDNPIVGYWKGRRGALHHSSKPVMTPRGPFGSVALAAEAFGVWRRVAWEWAKRGSDGYDTGWYFL